MKMTLGIQVPILTPILESDNPLLYIKLGMSI